MTITVADHIAAFLRDREVEIVFGLCGHTNIALLAALERGGGPRFVTTRHEQVAAHAADGYARASGRPGRRSPARRAGADQRDHWRGHRRPRLGADGRDRWRRPDLLREPRTAPGAQPASRRRPDERLRPVRQAVLAPPSCGPGTAGPRPRLGPGSSGAPGPRARVGADGPARRDSGSPDRAGDAAPASRYGPGTRRGHRLPAGEG